MGNGKWEMGNRGEGMEICFHFFTKAHQSSSLRRQGSKITEGREQAVGLIAKGPGRPT